MKPYHPKREIQNVKRLFLCFLILACFTPPILEAQPKRPLRDRLKVKKIDVQQAQELLWKFRNQRLKGDYCFDFKLRHLPRRGEEIHYRGRLWGSWNELGPVTRVQLFRESKKANAPLNILLQSGPRQHVWVLDENLDPLELTETELMKPILPGVLYAPFHLLMPFIFWDNWDYAGVQRVKGRPARQFLMFPPESYSQTAPNIKGVRMALDAKFNALLKADILDAEGRETKSFKILNFKKVQDQWIPRSIDLVDRTTRNKTRFEVSAAALNLNLPSYVFTPEGMKDATPELLSEQFDYFR